MNIWEPKVLTSSDKDFNFLQSFEMKKEGIICCVKSGLNSVTITTMEKTSIAGVVDHTTQTIYISNGEVLINDGEDEEGEFLFENNFVEEAKNLPEDIKMLFGGCFGIK